MTTQALVRTVGRNAGAYAFAEAVAKVGAAVFLFVVARLFGPTAFGELTFALSISTILVAFADVGFDVYLTLRFAEDARSIDELFWSSIVVKLAIGGAAIGLAAAVTVVAGYPTRVVAAVVLLGAAMLVELVGRSIQAVFRAIENMLPLAANAVVARTALIVPGVLLAWAGVGLVPISAVYLLASTASLTYLVLRLRREGVHPARTFDRSTARTLVAASLPIGIGTVFAFVLIRLDATLISFIKGSRAVGIYGAGYRLVDGSLFLSWTFGATLIPLFARSSPTSDPPLATVLATSCKVLSIALFLPAAACACYPTLIATTLFGSAFRDSAPVIAVLAGVIALFGAYHLANYVLVTKGRSKLAAQLLGVVVLLNLIANLVAVPVWSYVGAAVVMLASQLVLTTAALALAAREAGGFPALAVFAAPCAAALGVAAVRLALGERYTSLLVAPFAYVATLLAYELAFHRSELVSALRFLQRPAMPHATTGVGP